MIGRPWELGKLEKENPFYHTGGTMARGDMGEGSRGHIIKDYAYPRKELELHNDSSPELGMGANSLHVINFSAIVGSCSDGSMG